MPIIVFEGIDGAGKSTQSQMLCDRLRGLKCTVREVHFPRLNESHFGELIGSFLRGELGSNEEVDPRLVAMLYAGDRWGLSETLRTWCAANDWVILDRYYASNLAYQGAKIPAGEKREQLLEWIVSLELEYFKIPNPDCTLYLRTPPAFSEKRLEERRHDEEREYLQGKEDIHEADIAFQREVRSVFDGLGARIANYITIACADENDQILPPEIIHKAVWELVKNL